MSRRAARGFAPLALASGASCGTGQAASPLVQTMDGSASGNVWDVPSGAQWGLAKHNGWFWLPVAGDRHGGADDTQFVSQTDATN